MTTTDRDHIAELLDGHTLSYWSSEEPNSTWCKCGWRGSGFDFHRADVLLAAGVTLPDPTAETRTEWGVHYHEHGSTERWKPCRDRQDAKDWAGSIGYWHDPGDWKIRPHVVCRTVTTTAWTTPEEKP